MQVPCHMHQQINTERSSVQYSIFAKKKSNSLQTGHKYAIVCLSSWKMVAVMEMNVHVVTYVVIKLGVIFNSMRIITIQGNSLSGVQM